MPVTPSIERLTSLLRLVPDLLQEIAEEELTAKPAFNKWSKKEILGHLIDSATNNHQRFIRIQSENEPVIFYDQDQWNSLTGYNDLETKDLINFWKAYNLHIISIIKRVPPENFGRAGIGRDGQKHTLKWYFDDYVDHMEYHLRQIIAY
ncbi:hypothetical protein DYBT9275_01934 [Dyadobacter sp. CECT 9275]|uniref:DinB-like domain-containing protein n=1 Tax=Dyadobacter helix TaxID=2822344 RepID=A0A916JEM9_9BACT|nr:DinB family protein [Dyadobacter sp. CECT 9275]CAG4998130.1 hypothetical protein DYBT9275_01934 [Dyadobacter sp. CECT 9275]